MISEQKLSTLSYPDAPRIITDECPGPKTKKLMAEELKYESMTRASGSGPIVFAEAKGATLKDADGNVYIDLFAGTAVNSVGRLHPKVVQAIESQLPKMMHAGDCGSTARLALAKKISSIMPEGLRNNCLTSFTQSGSDAVEVAIKYSRLITGRSQFVAFHGGYHGVWNGSLALTTGEHFRLYRPEMPGVIHVPYPYCYRCPFELSYPKCGILCGKYFDYVLNSPGTGADDVAAVFIELIQGHGGYASVPPEFLRMIAQSCRKCGALLVVDEIQTGAGRTGKMWFIDDTGVVPDMLVWGKGMGGDLPMAGVSYRREFESRLIEGSQPNSFSCNSLSAAVCMANIDILTDKNDDIPGRVAAIGEEAKEYIRDLARNSKIIGDVRGAGLMIGVELVESRDTKIPLRADLVAKVNNAMLKHGIFITTAGRSHTVFRITPALIITREHLFKAIDVFFEAIREIENDINN